MFQSSKLISGRDFEHYGTNKGKVLETFLPPTAGSCATPLDRLHNMANVNDIPNTTVAASDHQHASDQNVDVILDDILDHIATDIACQLHHAIKMGQISDGPKRRLDLYSQIHATQEQMMESLRKYETDEPLQKRASILNDSNSSNNNNNDALLDPEDPDDEDAATNTTTSSSTPTSTNNHNHSNSNIITTTPIIMTRNQQNHNDIWNRLPPKEPKKLTTCTICNREVSALRFAPHLDKCMQLGSLRGAAAAANNSTTTTTTTTTTTAAAAAAAASSSSAASFAYKHNNSNGQYRSGSGGTTATK